MPLVLSILSVFGLLGAGGYLMLRFWGRAARMIEHDEARIYGESLTSWR